MAKGKGSRAGEQRRQQWSLSQIMDPKFKMPTDRAGLEKVYRTLAKTADQRLVRLERASEQDQFKVATKWAYARAQRDIKQWSGEGATRFNTKPPAATSSLRSKIEDIKTFLKSPTSTKAGIKEVYKKKADTINKKYGTNFKWDQVGKFFESKLAEDMDRKMDSATMLRVVAVIQSNKKDIIKNIEKADTIDIKVPDKMVKELTWETVKEYGSEVLEALFTK